MAGTDTQTQWNSSQMYSLSLNGRQCETIEKILNAVSQSGSQTTLTIPPGIDQKEANTVLQTFRQQASQAQGAAAGQQQGGRH